MLRRRRRREQKLPLDAAVLAGPRELALEHPVGTIDAPVSHVPTSAFRPAKSRAQCSASRSIRKFIASTSPADVTEPAVNIFTAVAYAVVSAGDGVDRSRLQPPGSQERDRRVPHGRPRPGVGAIGQREDADAVVRQQQHVRSVTRVSAAVAQRQAEVAVDRGEETHGIRRRFTARVCPTRSRSQPERGKVRPLRQLAHARAPHRAGIGAVASRPGRQQIRHPLRVVGGAGLDAAHRAESAMRHRRLEFPGVVLPSVAQRATLLGSGSHVVPGGRHAQRREQQAPGRSPCMAVPTRWRRCGRAGRSRDSSTPSPFLAAA